MEEKQQLRKRADHDQQQEDDGKDLGAFVDLTLPPELLSRNQDGDKTSLSMFAVMKEPKVCLIPNFISDEEIAHLLNLAEESKAWVPSVVWRGGDLEQRTSNSFMLRTSETPVVAAIEQRAAAVAGVPVEMVERLNVIRYSPGQQFGEHHDGSSRPSTVFVYLNNCLGGGGETRFGRMGVQVKPIKGCAVFWRNLHPDGSRDLRLMHQGMPPDKDVKYGLNCFISQTPRGAPNTYDNSQSIMMPPWWSRSSMGCRDIRVLSLRALTEAHAPQALREDSEDINYENERSFTVLKISSNPWFCAVPKFLDAEEIKVILDICPTHDDGWSPVPTIVERGNSCYYSLKGQPVASSIAEALSSLIDDVSPDLVDDVWIERYKPGQYISERLAGDRYRYSVLVYLDDLEGGEDDIGTDFKHCTFQFRALKGCAIIWQNTLKDGSIDNRLRHSELPLPFVRHHLQCSILAPS